MPKTARYGTTPNVQNNATTRTDKRQLLGNVCSRSDLHPLESDKMKRPGMGHNGPPQSEPFGLQAAWLRFSDRIELRRLAKLHLRIERKKQSIKELTAERQKIMNRCIRRMRRADGKN
jgi:hypothetical protein